MLIIIVFLPSPNNPTGLCIDNSDVARLCEEECIVVLDEAYADFANSTALDLYRTGRYPNLVVLRTFSKWAGLAGLRVGYGIMNKHFGSKMMQIKQPYNVTVTSALAAIRLVKWLSVP